MDVRLLGRRLANMMIAAVGVRDGIAGGRHRLQLSGRAGESKHDIRILTPYGFAMRIVPPTGDSGAETVVIAVESDLRYALPPADARWQPDDLEPGEVAMYTDEDKDGGCRIHLKRGRVVKITCRDADIEAENIARLKGRKVEIHATEELGLDCNGYGFRWQSLGGGYVVTNYTIGPVTGGTVAVAPPDIG